MRKTWIAITALGFAASGSAACATKGYVNTQITQVGQKVDTLSQSLEETQERTRQNEGKISEVDAKAQTAQSAATRAQQSAETADGRAVAAADSARAAGAKAEAVEAASRRIVFEVVISENQGNFKFGAAELPDEARARIDQLITEIKSNPRGAYFEIEGHTDDTGPAVTNYKLGLDRAEAVKRYLYEQHQIPLHRMNVISYGEDKPAVPNENRDTRAQNRRVVIKVLV
jgi:outer membrane protein OmpA-like peptidoglycan-associated protein